MPLERRVMRHPRGPTSDWIGGLTTAIVLAGCCIEGEALYPEDGVIGSAYVSQTLPFHLRVLLCRNGTCAERTLSDIVPSDPPDFDAAGPGRIFAATNAHGAFMVVEWNLDDVDYENGDIYRVRVFDELAQAEIYDFGQSVTYKETDCYDRATLNLPDVF